MASRVRGALAPIATQFAIFSVLRNRDFRVYWSGLLAQISGQMMMNVSIGWLAYQLSGSALFVASVTLVLAVPPLTIGLLGGVIADRFDPRRIISFTQGASVVNMLVLGILTLTGNIERWHLYIFTLVHGVVQSFDQPSRQVLYPRFFADRRPLAAAVSVNALTWQIVRLVAPAVAGNIIAYVGSTQLAGAGGARVDFVGDARPQGFATVFFLCSAGFATMVLLVNRIRLPATAQRRRVNVVKDLAEGARIAYRTPIFRVALLVTYAVALFGMGYQWVLPVYVGQALDADSRALGWLWTAGGIGSFIGVLTTPYIVRRFPTGRVIIFWGLAFGLTLIVFSFTRTVPAAMAVLVVVGLSSLAFMVGIEVTIQVLVEDAVRGRIMALYSIAWSLPPLGAAALNAMADSIGAPRAIAIGGIIVVVSVALVLALSPTLRGLGIFSVQSPRAVPTAPVAVQPATTGASAAPR